MAAIMFHWPNFFYTHHLCRLLVYIFPKMHQTFGPRSCKVNKNFDTSWNLTPRLEGLSKQTEFSMR